MTPEEKNYDIGIKSAERAHDFQRKALEMHSHQIEAFSLAGMRAPAFVAAGGLAAALAFYSANRQVISSNVQASNDFASVLYWLLLGLLLTVVAPGCAYFSQLAYTYTIDNRTHHFAEPYVRDTPKSRASEKVGDFFRWGAVAIVALSIVAVAMGGVSLLHMIRSLH